jgi:hypothetical protein
MVILLIGKRTPILPVEHTNISLEWRFKWRATSDAILAESEYPCSPVQALAFPLFATIA